MEIIAQAAIGLSNFLHPDYVSATPTPQYILDYYENFAKLHDLVSKILAITALLILVILIANYVTNLVKRYKRW